MSSYLIHPSEVGPSQRIKQRKRKLQRIKPLKIFAPLNRNVRPLLFMQASIIGVVTAANIIEVSQT